MPESLLVYSMGEVIGDGLIKLPFVAGLRAAFPQAQIAWTALGGDTVYAGALKAVVAGCIDTVIATGPGGLDRPLWAPPFSSRKFDLILDTQEHVGRSLWARRARAPGGMFISPALGFALSDRKPGGPFPTAVTERLAVLLRLAAGEGASAQPIRLADPNALAAAALLLPPGPVYVGFAPGAGGASKRWPLERFLSVAQQQAAAGRTPVFFFGPDEAEEVAAARAAVPSALFPEQDRTDGLPQVRGPLLAIALAGRLAAAVANDAGPGHMLAAGGAPLVSLQRDRRRAAKFRPAAERLEVLVAEDYGADMAALPIEPVTAALERLLGEKPA